MTPFDELRRALRRTDLLLLRAVRRMRSRPASPARGDLWGPAITDDGLDELLRQVGEWGPVPTQAGDGASLEASLRQAESHRDGNPRLSAVRRRLGLSTPDVDVLLLALAPDVFEGYGRILAWLNDYATMPWATVDTALRVLEPHRAGRLALLGRLLPDAPLVRSGALTLTPMDPAAPLLSQHRLEVSRALVWELLGLEAALLRPLPGGPLLDLIDAEANEEDTGDPESERTEDLPSALDLQVRARELNRKWTLFVGAGARQSSEAARAEPEPSPQPQASQRVDEPRRAAPGVGLSLPDATALSDRLRRADLLVLHAVRQQRAMPWMAEASRGRELLNLSVISDREVQSLLRERGDPYPRGGTGLEEALARTEEVRDAPGGPWQLLRERCGLLPVDLDILALALLPEVAAGYRRLYHFLNSFVHDHLNIGLIARILGDEPEDRLLVRSRLQPDAPLLREGLLTLHAVFPVGDHVAGLRVGLHPQARSWLLGHGEAPGRAPGRVLSWTGPRPVSGG